MKYRLYGISAWLLAGILNCTAAPPPLAPAAGKVRAPITIDSTVQTLPGGKRLILLTIKPWEILDSARFALRKSRDYELLSTRGKTQFVKMSDEQRLQFTVLLRKDNLESVIIDFGIKTGEQEYLSSHEILLAERPVKAQETIKSDRRKVKELK
jgi:hypothetical protein